MSKPKRDPRQKRAQLVITQGTVTCLVKASNYKQAGDGHDKIQNSNRRRQGWGARQGPGHKYHVLESRLYSAGNHSSHD